jgi:hypothetical protein
VTVQPVTIRLIERLAHRNALGIRFNDVHLGEPVGSGLSVQVVLKQRSFPALPTPSGAYTVRFLPGLGPWQTRGVDLAGEEEPVQVDPFTVRIEVRDQFRRFLPCLIETTLPAGGLVAVPYGSPPSPPPGSVLGVPLYSAPGRDVPVGLAVVRATLVRASGGPAAFAALEVVPEPGVEPVRGIADERGEVAVLFAYPSLPRRLGSPPTSTRRALGTTTWTVEVRAFLPRQPPGPLPQVDRLLDQRPAALTTTTPPAVAVTHAEVSYGRECVLRSSPVHAELAVGP